MAGTKTYANDRKFIGKPLGAFPPHAKVAETANAIL
jgi:hypothetical protein